MREFFLNFHSGWRYLVILALIIMFVFYLYEYFTKANRKEERIIDLVVSIILHTQVGLGILLLIFDIVEGLFEMREIGHVFMMGLILPLTIVYSKRVKTATPEMHRTLGLAMPVVTFVLIIAGLAAISRPLFGS